MDPDFIGELLRAIPRGDGAAHVRRVRRHLCRGPHVRARFRRRGLSQGRRHHHSRFRARRLQAVRLFPRQERRPCRPPFAIVLAHARAALRRSRRTCGMGGARTSDRAIRSDPAPRARAKKPTSKKPARRRSWFCVPARFGAPPPCRMLQSRCIYPCVPRHGRADCIVATGSSRLNATDHRFCVAPMMEWTDRHCRFFHRLMTRRALLYTEMVTTGAVLHGDRARLIGFDPFEHPLALQLGGSDPGALAQCARIARISAMTRSISMSAVRRTGCRRAASAPA